MRNFSTTRSVRGGRLTKCTRTISSSKHSWSKIKAMAELILLGITFKIIILNQTYRQIKNRIFQIIIKRNTICLSPIKSSHCNIITGSSIIHSHLRSRGQSVLENSSKISLFFSR